MIERSQDDEEIAEILFEIREDVAAFAVNASRLMKTEDKLREAREKELVRNETLKQAFMNLLKDSGVYDAILEDAKEVAARKASSEVCRLSGIEL